MQTFIIGSSFLESAAFLDRLRLDKQRIECKQILMANLGESTAWKNHPVTKAWSGHERAIAMFGCHCCREWRDRGYKDSLMPWFIDKLENHPLCKDWNPIHPYWFYSSTTQQFYQALLFSKAPEIYLQWKDIPFPAGCHDTKSMLETVQKDIENGKLYL